MEGNVIRQISDFVGWDIRDTIEISKKAPTSYKRYVIPKKKPGEFRSVFHPAKQTKTIQYALLELVISTLPVHECAFAYRHGLESPLRKHATLHAGSKYTVRVDMKDFFPSIRPLDLFSVINKQRREKHYQEITEAEKNFLANALFIRHPQRGVGLAIGAPSSPAVSNTIMYGIDTSLHNYAKRRNGVYSRYADDLVFSANKKDECAKFVDRLEKLLAKTRSPSLTINAAKTLYMSTGTRRTVTGLFVTPQRKISIGRKNKRYIRKLLFEYKKGSIDPNLLKYLQGYLSFILDVEPTFYNSIVIKYGAELVSRALASRLPSLAP